MIFKCKMCGGDIEIVKGSNIAKCQYCKSTMTLPNLENEKITNLYNRANDYRMANEFDKAYGVYETILEIDNSQVEAHWGLLLCKFGVEYVDDPKTKEKIPTCHRTITTSILKDNEFKIIKNNSYGEVLNIYQKEAENIDKIQKSILEISSKEEPYDIFICYKETDSEGNRTNDSVIAQDIYDKLIDKGYKVFFSRITLENKLGSEYEPYIYSALNSARIMLVVGTSEDNYNAVWVKNEWSRFLEMMKTDKRKVLIPVYSKVEAYKLPEEFAIFQAQSMDKIGAMQDLMHGIEKLISDSKKKNIADEDVEKIRQAMDEATNLGNGQYEVVIMKEKFSSWYYAMIILLPVIIGVIKIIKQNTQSLFNHSSYGIINLNSISPTIPILYFLTILPLFVGIILKFLGRKKYRISKFFILGSIITELLSICNLVRFGYFPYGGLDKIGVIISSFILFSEALLLVVNPKWHIDSSSKVVMNKENKEKRQEINNKIIKEFKEKEEKIIHKKYYIGSAIIVLIFSLFAVYMVAPFKTSVEKSEDNDQLEILGKKIIYKSNDFRYPCGYVLEKDYVDIITTRKDKYGIDESYKIRNGKNISGYIKADQTKMIYGKNSEFYGITTQSNERNTNEFQVKVITEEINIRDTDKTDGKILGKVKKDEIYTVLEEKVSEFQTWYKIKTNYGVIGYIADRYENTFYLEKLYTEEQKTKIEQEEKEYSDAMNAIEGVWYWKNSSGYSTELKDGEIIVIDNHGNRHNGTYKYKYDIESKTYKMNYNKYITFDGTKIRMYEDNGEETSLGAFKNYATRN